MTTKVMPENRGLKRYIRLSGLIGFFALMLLISGLCYFFAETFVKSAIEQTGSSVLGAEVNVASVSIQYSPLELTVNNIEATDADLPSHNMFSVEKITASIDLWQYLLGKTIIEKLQLDRLELMTERSRVGEVYHQSNSEVLGLSVDKTTLPAMDLQLPNLKSLLEDSNLLTVKAATELQKSYDEEKLKLNALTEKLPSKAKLAAYQVKIKNIGKMKVKSLADFNKVKAEFDSVKQEFNADQAIVKEAKEQLLASKQRIMSKVTALKNAPNKDWQTIESKYQLDNVNTEDFAHILFGEQARDYFKKAEDVYHRISPYLGNGNESDVDDKTPVSAKGRFIHFDEDSPLPDFLIRQARMSMVLEQGDFEVVGQELTHQHWYRNKASKLTLSSTKLAHGGDVNMNSQFELTKDGHSFGEGQWSIKQLALENMLLTDAKSLALALVKGKLSGAGKFSVNQENNLSSENNFVLTEAAYHGEASTKFAEILLDTFKSLDKFTLGLNADGSIKQPNLSISSSLDQAVKGAFKKQIANKLGDFKTEVNSGLNEKLAQSLKLNDQNNAELINLETLLGDTDNALEQLKNSDVVKQQKEKLQNKATDKIKGKLSDLFG